MKGIASGVFSFKIVNTNDYNDTINVTNGRFDLKIGIK